MRAAASRALRSRRGTGLALLAAASGCASAPAPIEPVAPAPIDLEPRCLEIAAAPAIGPLPAVEQSGDAGEIRAWQAPGGIEGWTVSTPSAGLESLAWGFGPTRPEDSFALELSAALLRGGHTAAKPTAFRARRRTLGGAATVHVEEGWLWLELRHLPRERAAAVEQLLEWVETRPVEPAVFAATRRSVSLTRLAEEASATRLASRAFERLSEKPAGAVGDDPALEDGSGSPPEWTPSTLDAFLRRLLRPERSVLLVSQTGAAGTTEPSSERLRRHFARQPPAPEAAPRGAAGSGASGRGAAIPPEPGALHLVDRPGSPQVEILVGHPTVGPGNVDAPALEMLASLLGGDVGGRLFRDLRERQGLAYILNAFQEPEGRFVVTTRARPDRVPSLILGIEAHLRALRDRPLLGCEVRDLRRRMAGEETLRVDDPEALRARLRAEIGWSGRPRSSSERRSARARLDAEALEAAARRYLDGPPIVVLVGDEAALRHPLSAGLPGRSLRIVEVQPGPVE